MSMLMSPHSEKRLSGWNLVKDLEMGRVCWIMIWMGLKCLTRVLIRGGRMRRKDNSDMMAQKWGWK